MAVSVVSGPDATRLIFDGAEGWHVDDDGRLHVKDPSGKGNIATFHAGAWSYAMREDVQK